MVRITADRLNLLMLKRSEWNTGFVDGMDRPSQTASHSFRLDSKASARVRGWGGISNIKHHQHSPGKSEGQDEFME